MMIEFPAQPRMIAAGLLLRMLAIAEAAETALGQRDTPAFCAQFEALVAIDLTGLDHLALLAIAAARQAFGEHFHSVLTALMDQTPETSPVSESAP